MSEMWVRQLYRGVQGFRLHTATLASEINTAEEEFRTLELKTVRQEKRTMRDRKLTPILPPRYKRQKLDQNWGNVWPTARTFHPATVPFPVRQGYPATGQPTPDKWGNAELMKIPNFLHLTPPIIKQQCEVLKKFCTPWPAGLETPAKQNKHFPVTVSINSYLHSSPSLRDARARIVTMKVSVKSLELDNHGRDKLLRLVKDHHDPKTDTLTLVADRCPLSSQNRDYCTYLLTVLYTEAMKTEPWEHEKNVADYERYVWEGSLSEAAARAVFSARDDSPPEHVINEYAKAVVELHNEGEDDSSVSRYRESVLKLVGLT
ncbi:hypothetical protein Pmani_038743 [Petrolisthes manimaculis]|uniref:Small ribosomal subunit protein mS35 mitochondrial conserved domain-containing protein n=1 Tax=Petrolisthes manimaculis TaxID=1843537 RepID=A0AAE1TM01_9EUCA|nr:hypothetical protein Pmani_038743 [Petrolisthes manimaculis]